MKSNKKILLAFLLNLLFSIFEFIGGTLTGSVAIISDAFHDFGDSLSIGLSYIFEKVSLKKPNQKYTYGYIRYSVLGGIIQSVILLCGSVFVIFNAVNRLINPKPINYNGMIIIAVVGFIINLVAAYFTKGDESINQKAINLHMLEDVLGWAIVLIGAVVMKFTQFSVLDAVLSILLAAFIIINAFKNIKQVLDIFVQKTPSNVDIEEITHHLMSIEGIEDVHHIHIWSMDGYSNLATLHIVTDRDFSQIKAKVKNELKEHGISHTTVECENVNEVCSEQNCEVKLTEHSHHHHHHH